MMASRPVGYGMSGEVHRKINAKYSPELEQEARQWLEQLLGKPLVEGADPNEPLGETAIQDALKDGVILCEAVNVLKPGAVKKIHRVTSGPMKQFRDMENIGNFLSAIEQYGVVKVDQFQTANLTDRRNNMAMVINTIHALGRAAQKNGYTGPTLGPKEAEQNPRNFSEEVLHKGQSVIGQQYGYTQGASQKGMIFGKPRSITD